jgi:hypothetical protein
MSKRTHLIPPKLAATLCDNREKVRAATATIRPCAIAFEAAHCRVGVKPGFMMSALWPVVFYGNGPSDCD